MTNVDTNFELQVLIVVAPSVLTVTMFSLCCKIVGVVRGDFLSRADSSCSGVGTNNCSIFNCNIILST